MGTEEQQVAAVKGKNEAGVVTKASWEKGWRESEVGCSEQEGKLSGPGRDPG